MNVEARLAAEVERAMARVVASPGRVREMREELLGHLMAVYEDALERAGDADVAAREAVGRFGADDLLGRELARSVPWFERVWYLFWSSRKENSMSRWIWVVGVVVVFVGLAFVMPAVAKLREVGVGEQAAFLMMGVVVMLAGVAGVAYGLVRGRRAVS